jgi:L-asparaginase II
LRRYLNHEPVSARPDSLTYRTGKFVVRNRLAVGAAAIVLLTIVAAAAVSIWQAIEATRQRDLALSLAARNEAVLHFVNGMLTEVARWSGTSADEIPIAVDGCGVSTFGLTLAGMATAYAAYAGAARRGVEGPARLVQAMVRNPEYVAGSERMCTDLMRVARGRIFAKVGAEGVYLAGIPGAELAVALKVTDGATRASEPALLATLKVLGLLSDDEIGQLEKYAEPEVMNTRNERVGTIRAHIRLEAVA